MSTSDSLPVFLFIDQAGFAFGLNTFDNYKDGTPASTIFTVPSQCEERIHGGRFKLRRRANHYNLKLTPYNRLFTEGF